MPWVLPVYELVGQVDTTVRIISILGVLATLLIGVRTLKPGPAWPEDRRRKVNLAVAAASVLLWITNSVVGSVGLLMLLFVGWISAPLGTFANAILELRDEDLSA